MLNELSPKHALNIPEVGFEFVLEPVCDVGLGVEDEEGQLQAVLLLASQTPSSIHHRGINNRSSK